MARVGTTKTRHRYSLRLRIFLTVTIAALVPQLVVFAWSQLERPIPGQLWTRVRDAIEAAAPLVDDGASDLAPVAKANHVRLRVLDPNDDTVADRDFDAPPDHLVWLDRSFFGPIVSGNARDDELGPLRWRPAIETARERGEFIDCTWDSTVVCEGARRVETSHGTYVVHAQASTMRAVQGVYELRAYLLRLAIVTVPLGLLLALYAARRVMRPIENLRDRAIEQAKVETPDVVTGELDEIADVAEAFNALLRAIDERRTDKEAFVADLVHELKSPVAVVRAAAESLAASPGDAARTERLAKLLGDSARKLDRSVTQFLELARAEAGMPNEERSKIDLGSLLRALVDHARDDARHVDVRFELDADDGVVVDGVAHRIDAITRELIENAASFAGTGGVVSVRVHRRAGWAVLDVYDSGPGISPDDLPRVFDRFFTTRAGRRGSGLGLALVKAVTEAHGGTVSVRSTRGTCFTVRLP